MNSKNRELVAEMIARVESNSRWNAYSDPQTISAKEHTITIGAYQFGGGSNEARDLLKLIKEDYPEVFKKYDTCGIAATLSKDWYSTYFNPTATQKKQIIALISTPEGIATQKKYFCDIELPAYLKRAEEFGLKTQKCQALWVEIQHLGGLNPTKRIFNRIKAETVDEVDRANAEFALNHQDGADPTETMMMSMYMLGAMEYFDTLESRDVHRIALEIAMVGVTGIHPKKKYSIKSIPGKEFGGYQFLAYYYVSWARAIPEKLDALGLPFSKAYESALQMYNAKYGK